MQMHKIMGNGGGQQTLCNQIGTNLPLYLDSLKQTQPRVLVLGDRVKPEQVFIIVEKHVITCKSLLQAVDLAFKTNVLWTDYSWQASYTWDAIEKIVYGLEGKGKQLTPSATRSLRSFLSH